MPSQVTLGDPTILFSVGVVLVGILGFLIFFAIRAEREKARSASARRSEERLNNVLSGTDLGFWDWDIEKGEVHFDQNWYRESLGYVPFSSGRIADFVGTLVHPDDLSAANTALYDHLKNRTNAYQAEVRYRTSTGQWLWVLTRARVYARDGTGKALKIAGADAVIEVRKRAEELMAVEKEIAIGLNGLSDVNEALDRFLHASLKMEAIDRGLVFRKSANGESMEVVKSDSLFGTRLDDGIAGIAWTAGMNSCSEVIVGEALAQHPLGVAMGESDGEGGSWALVPLLQGDRCFAFMLLGSHVAGDFSESVLRSLNQLTLLSSSIFKSIGQVVELREAHAALAKLNELQRRFLSILSHDLRGPLGSLHQILSSMVEEPEDWDDEEERMEVLETCSASAARVTALLEDTLTWARSQFGEGGDDLVVRDFSVLDCLESSVELHRTGVEEKGVEIELSVAEGAIARGDENICATVVRNLLSNAIKFTPDGGRIVVSVVPVAQGWEIAVEDDGVGIPKDRMEQLLDPLKRFTTPGTRKETGTGMGLALCQSLLEQCDSELLVSSEEGKGSRFSFVLPFGLKSSEG